MITVSFVAGTLEVRGAKPDESGVAEALAGSCTWDPRTRSYRGPAVAYAELVRALVAAKIAYEDGARRYAELTEGARVKREPRPYQTEAIDAWRKARGRGVVVLPTGSGKSHVAILA